jgi:hypothetical protein
VKKIINQVLLLFIVSYLIIYGLYRYNVVSYEFLSASFYAGIINALNVTAALLAFNYTLNKSNSAFLIFNMGGMVVRLFVLLGIFLIFLKFLNIDKSGFIFTFFFLYFISLILEINYFRIKAIRKND